MAPDVAGTPACQADSDQEVDAEGASFRDKLAGFERWADAVIRDEGWSTLEIEFASQVRSDPTLGTALADRAASIRAVIATLISAGAAEAGRELPMPAEELATALLSLGLGIALQRAFDKQVTVRALTDTIRVFAGLPVLYERGG